MFTISAASFKALKDVYVENAMYAIHECEDAADGSYSCLLTIVYLEDFTCVEIREYSYCPATRAPIFDTISVFIEPDAVVFTAC